MALSNTTEFALYYYADSATLPTSDLVVGGLYFWQGNIYLAQSETGLDMLGPVSFVDALPADGVAGRLYLNKTDSTINIWSGTEFVTVSDPSTLAASKLTGAIPTTVTVGTSGSPVASESYVADAISVAVASVMHYKGTVAATSNLPTTGMVVGDVWNISADGTNWAYTDDTTEPEAGSVVVKNANEETVGYWEKIGTTVDLSAYATLADDQTFTGNVTFTNKITGTADKADALSSSQNISIKGGATAAAVSFDGTGAVELDVTSLDATKLTGTAAVDTTGNAATATDAVNVTGTIGADVTATTQTAGDNSTKVATTAYVDTAVANVNTALTWHAYN